MMAIYEKRAQEVSLMAMVEIRDWCQYQQKKLRSFDFWFTTINMYVQGTFVLLNLIVVSWAVFVSLPLFLFALWQHRKSAARRRFYKSWGEGMDFFLAQHAKDPKTVL